MPKLEILVCDNCGAREEGGPKADTRDGWVLRSKPYPMVFCPTCWRRILTLAKPLVMKLVKCEPKLFAEYVRGTQFEVSCRVLSDVFAALRTNYVLGDG